MSEHLKQAKDMWVRSTKAVLGSPAEMSHLRASVYNLRLHLEAQQSQLDSQFAVIWAELDRRQPQQSQVPPHRHPLREVYWEPLETPQSGPTSSAPTAGRASPCCPSCGVSLALTPEPLVKEVSG